MIQRGERGGVEADCIDVIIWPKTGGTFALGFPFFGRGYQGEVGTGCRELGDSAAGLSGKKANVGRAIAGSYKTGFRGDFKTVEGETWVNGSFRRRRIGLVGAYAAGKWRLSSYRGVMLKITIVAEQR